MSQLPISYADWSAAEYWSAIRCVLKGRVASGENVERLAQWFAKRYGPSTAHPVNFGHTGLLIALAAFARRRPGRTDVLVPAYICPIVVQTIVLSGLNPVPVDIGDDLNLTPESVVATLTDRTLAVIAAHMFGCPARIDEIESICREADVFLIDDSAQVVGIAQGGRLLGTFGDVGIISFAQSKSVVTGVAGSGGILLVNNAALAEEMRMASEHLPLPVGRAWAFISFVWSYMWEVRTGRSSYYLRRLGGLVGLSNVPASVARISNLDAGIALVQLRRLATMQRATIEVAERFQRELEGNRLIGFPQYAQGRYLARIMLLLPEDADIAAVRSFLAAEGIGTRLGYAVPFAAAHATRRAEAWSRRLLGIPCGVGIEQADVKRICRALNDALRASSPNT